MLVAPVESAHAASELPGRRAGDLCRLSAPAGQPRNGSVSHHHRKLRTQDVLDWIRYEAMPYNPMLNGLPLKLKKKILKLRINGTTFIHPLSAFILHDEAEFRASCHGYEPGGYSLYAVAQWASTGIHAPRVRLRARSRSHRLSS